MKNLVATHCETYLIFLLVSVGFDPCVEKTGFHRVQRAASKCETSSLDGARLAHLEASLAVGEQVAELPSAPARAMSRRSERTGTS